MQEISFTIYMVPVAKGRPRFARMGRFVKTYTPTETIIAENNILAQAIRYKPDLPFSKGVSITVRFFMPIPNSMSKKQRALAIGCALPHTKKPDLDNLLKTIDALNGVFWVDDSLIHSITVSKSYHERPCIEFYIKGE